MTEDNEKNNNTEKNEHKRLVELFNEIRSLYARNIEFVEYQAYDFFPCWIIATYIFQWFESFPYVYLHSPKRSGKTKTLTLTSKLAHNSEFAVNMNQAVSYRIIEDRQPTLLIDEADYLSSEEKAELYKILNAGYKRGSYVYRCEVNGKKIDYRKWNVYCPKMLASVNELKEQFIDRCIIFHLVRSRNKEIANSIIRENVDDNGVKWEVWTSAIEQYILKLKPDIMDNFDNLDSDERMEEIIGRDRELWLPILAVAKTLNPEILENLINLALEKVARTREQEKETLENAIISELWNMVTEDSWVYVNDIHSRLKSKVEWEWLNPRTTGKTMRRLNFQLKHAGKGSMYLVKVDELKELARRYSVELTDNNDNSDNSDENDENEQDV